MIQVGINQNVRIAEVKKDDNGLLNVEFADSPATSGGGDQAATNFMDAFTSTSESDMDYTVRHIFWPVKYGEYVKNMEDVIKEFKNMRQQLNHILLQFMTEDKIKWDPMVGIQVTNPQDPAEMQRLLSNDATLLAMYNNYAAQFIQLLTPHIAAGTLFRMKFVRQSQQKHYASLPKFPPFMEPMTIPADQSKLKFSQYEIDKGLNSGKPVDTQDAPAPDPEVLQKQSEDIASVFGEDN